MSANDQPSTNPPARMGDVWGALAAMLVALPSAIAFGLVIYTPLGAGFAAQGAIAGILGAIVIGIVAPLFGGTPRLISAPCGPAAAVLAALALDLAQSHAGTTRTPETIILLLTLLTLFTGVLQIVFGLVGGGRLIKYIPYPVVAGYLSSVGVLIFISQVPKLFGLDKKIAVTTGLLSPSSWSAPALLVGCVTIAIMILAPMITKRVPGPILALAGGLIAYFAMSALLPDLRATLHNPLVIGPIGASGGFDPASIFSRWLAITRLGWGDLRLILIPSLTLAVLLSIDTLKTCVVVDALTRSRHDSNRELRGQGLGNLGSALAGGIPGAGTMGATLINVSSGGRTRWSSVLEGIFALLAFLIVGSLIAWVPIAALAGILMVVAFRMVDRNIFHLLRERTTILDFAVVAAVVVTAIVSNLIAAAGVGLALAILLFVREQIRGSVVRRKKYGDRSFSKRQRLPEERAILEQQGALTVICELQGSLFFGTTDQLFTELQEDLARRRYVILDLRRVQSVDFTAIHLLDQIEARLAERGGVLIFSHLPPTLPTGQDLSAYFDHMGLTRPSRSIRVFAELDEALEWVEGRWLEEAGLNAAADETPLDLSAVHLFKGIDDDTLTALAACAEARSYAAGQPVFMQGDAGDEIFLIRRGTVRISLRLSAGRMHHLATCGRGDFFGDMSFIAPAARSADAVATAPLDLYAISRSRFDAVAVEHPALDKKVFWRLARALATRLRQTDAELRALEEL
ncbi:MAG: SulP family inorganic anion transporter [Vicinamibacteria bacterium]|jgi:SulP family sulfate permease|nr:SulP family inorganic anion transporter [Vicinamibacteria bacterium]